MHTKVRSFYFRLEIPFFWQIWSKKSRSSVWAVILNQDYFQYVQFDGDVQFFYARPYFASFVQKIHLMLHWLILQQFTGRDLESEAFFVFIYFSSVDFRSLVNFSCVDNHVLIFYSVFVVFMEFWCLSGRSAINWSLSC